jgi:hypothetical protein
MLGGMRSRGDNVHAEYVPAKAISHTTTFTHRTQLSESSFTSDSTGATTYFNDPQPGPSPLSVSQGRVKYVYSYSLSVGLAQMQFLVSVEPTNPTRAGQYTFRLSIKTNGVERSLCEPVILNLRVDPSSLEFAVFMFPPKASLPAGCLHSLRVWLRTNGVDHRLFAEDELWIGKDPDFNSIAEASFARLTGINHGSQFYQGFAGNARVTFSVSWQRAAEGVYNYSLEYEAGGAGATLFENYPLQLECDPRSVTFLIYTIPISSSPPGASHRLRVWLRAVCPSQRSATSLNAPFSDSHIYQRIWNTDTFKVGAQLDFTSLGRKFIVGVPDSLVPRVAPLAPLPLRPVRANTSRKEDIVM